MTNLKSKILQLRELGYSFRKIASILGCNKNSVTYHLSPNLKKNNMERQRKKRRKQHPFILKIENFLFHRRASKNNFDKQSTSNKTKLSKKIVSFFKKSFKNMNITVSDVINKIGENPRCYLTGEKIDVSQPKTYHFDHIIPTSKNGLDILDNLEIATADANKAKHNLLLPDFIELCKKVCENFGYEVIKK